ASSAPVASTGKGVRISASGATTSSIVLKMRSASPLLRASSKRSTAALLVACWPVDIWFSLLVRRSHQRCEVADWPEVGQLVGVDDRADAGDLAAGDLEPHHREQPLLRVEIERTGAAVDLDRAQRQAPSAGAQAAPVGQRVRDTGAAA